MPIPGLNKFTDVSSCFGMPPWVMIMFLFMLAIFMILIPQTQLTTNKVGIEAEIVICSMFVISPTIAFVFMTWLKRRSLSSHVPPILAKVKLFRSECDRKGWRLERCERGPCRAVTAAKILRLRNFFHEFLRSRSMYYVVSNIVKPLTEPDNISFSEFVGPSSVQWFISHYWGSPFIDFAATIECHAKEVWSFNPQIQRSNAMRSNTTLAASWSQVSYWICTFSLNQWNVREEVGDGHWEQSSFYHALTSESCQGTMMVMDIDVLPLTRSWCLFELLQTFKRKNRLASFGSSCEFQFVLGTVSGVLNHGGTMNINLTLQIGQAIAGLSLENAQASEPQDKEMIDGLVMEMGGFEFMNNFIRNNVLEVLHSARDQVAKGFDDLESLLRRDSKDSEEMDQGNQFEASNEKRSQKELPQLLSQPFPTLPPAPPAKQQPSRQLSKASEADEGYTELV
eukprot:TRINITY_DN16866_c0_g1_i2.p1 TRINITY_DN16866_c0_g1~~TRINITY_DN16866_c0_g1_i2.p1  ORF type:complete len:453 (+),score=92.75 TRINITY_DN16866_c0_g1_i2:217-1575(+)